MKRLLIKVCGMRDSANIRQIEQLGADMLGFIFYQRSPRAVLEQPDYLPTQAKRVGVFVNEALDVVKSTAQQYGLDYIQLHGNEIPEYCMNLLSEGYKIIKNIPIETTADLEMTKLYETACHLFLFDTKCSSHGGSGKRFDWSVLNAYEGNTPFLLSGGIGVEQLHELQTFTHEMLLGYDINSRFECSPGLKDQRLVATFIQQVKEQ